MSLKDKAKKLETGLWKAMEPVGRWSNKVAGKMGAEAFYPTDLSTECVKAARILRTFTLEGAHADDSPGADDSGGVDPKAAQDPYASRKTQKVVKKIPPKALQKAAGIAVFTCFRTGLGWSGAGGSGIVMARLPDGSWGPPSGLLVHTLGWGFLVGLDIYDVVLIIRSPETLKAFTRPKISAGGEFSVAAGPIGNGAALESGLEGKPVWQYTKSKGAYAGVQLDGTIILKRDDENARFYGEKVSVADIFAGKVTAPAGAKPLLQTLYAAEGRPNVMGTDQIPEGQTPGDKVISEEEAKEMESHSAEAGAGAGAGAGAAAGAGAGTAVASEVPPPSYDGAAPASQPRDAAAEKDALRQSYANQDRQAAGATGAAGATASPSRVQAVHDFTAVEENEDLPFKAGQVIDVLGAEDDAWYRGRYTTSDGKTLEGIFPKNYVKSI